MDQLLIDVTMWYLKMLFVLITPVLDVLITMWNIMVPLLAIGVFLIIETTAFVLSLVVVKITIVAAFCGWIAYAFGALLLRHAEGSINALVSDIGTWRNRRAFLRASADPASFLWLPRGPPRTIDADCLRLVEEYITVRFDVRRWLSDGARPILLVPIPL